MREMRILLFLSTTPVWDTARDVAEQQGIVKSQISPAVESLVQKGHLIRKSDSYDRRIIHLHLTASGQEIAERGISIQNNCANKLFEDFTAKEQVDFFRLLDKFIAGGERMMGGTGK